MMRLRRLRQDHDRAGSLESFVGIHAAIDDRAWVTTSGDVLTVLKATPHDYECLDPDQLDAITRRYENVARSLGEDFRIRQYLLRREHPGLAREPNDDPAVEEILEKRDQFFRERA